MQETKYDRLTKKALIEKLVEAERRLRRAGEADGPGRTADPGRRRTKTAGAAERPDTALRRQSAKTGCAVSPDGADVQSASESDCAVLGRDGRVRRLYRVVKDIRDNAGNPVFSEGALYEINPKPESSDDAAKPDAQGESDRTELICRFKPNGTLTYVNEAYCRYFGFEKTDLQGRNVLLSISEADRENVYSRLQGLRPERPVDTVEYRVENAFGDVLWNQWTYRALFDDSGNVLEYQSVGRDITFRKYTQEVLEKRAAILEAVTYAAEVFLKSDTWRDRIERVLERFGAAMNASHVFLCENRVGEGGRIAVPRSYEWQAPQARETGSRRKFLRNSRLAVRFSEWVFAKSEGRPIYGSIGSFPEKVVGDLELDRQLSIAVVPILSGDRWWGFVGFADYTGEAGWSEDEIAPLGAASEILGAAIEREEKERVIRETHATIRGQERFLAGIFDAIQDGLMVASPDMTILRVNRAVEKRFPHVDTFTGRKCHEVFHGRKRPCENCQSLRAVETGEAASGVHPIVGPDGDCRGWVEVYSYPLRDDDTGELKGVIEYSRDITEKKRAEEALRASEERYRELAELLPVGVYEADFGGTFTYANAKAMQLFGYGEDEVRQGIHFSRVVAPEEHEIARMRSQDVRRGKEIAHTEYTFVRKDGSRFPGLLMARPLVREGRVVGSTGVVTDITAFKKAEAALQASEARYRELADHLPVGIYEAGFDGTVCYANIAAMEMFGYSAEEVAAGVNFAAVVAPEERELMMRNVKSIREGTPLVYQEYTMLRRDGSRFPAMTRSRPLVRDGRIVGSTGIVTDIGELKRAQESLRQNEALLAGILRAAPVGVGLVRDRVLGWVNEGMTALTGYEARELEGKSARILYPDREEYERVGRDKYAQIEARGIGSVETRWRRKDGTVLDILLSSAPVDSRNPAAGVVFTALDITAQKKAARILLFAKQDLEKQVAEQTRELDVANMLLRIELEEHRKTEKALVQSEQLYRAIVEDQTELICRFRPDGTISFVNDAFCRFFGKTREEILGTRYRPMPPEDQRTVRDALRGVNPENPLIEVEIRAERPDGELRWMQWTDRALYDESGTLVEHLAVGRDITDRVRSEQQIRESRNTLRAVFDGISDPLVMVREDMTVVMLNRAALQFFGAALYRELIGAPCLEFFRGRYGEEATRLVRAAVAAQEPARHELETKGETARYEEVFVYPVQTGRLDHGMAIIRITDRTRQRLMERELIQSEKLASLGLLISGIVHEINNPNNFISFNMPILRDYIRDVLPVLDEHAARTPGYEVQGMPYADFREDVLKLLDNIEHGSTRINATVAKLKEFSRKKDEKGARPILPTEVIEKAVAICHTQVRKTVKTFDVEVQQAMPGMITDPDAVEQTLINLLINAAQAADKPDSRIRLTAQRGACGEGLVLEVEDNGCGMDRKTAARIFDPFFTTKAQGLGTGLGLYISKNLIESAGGSITVESEIGRGTTFRVVLPDLKDHRGESRTTG